jgi:quinol monooxygenase YgiN
VVIVAGTFEVDPEQREAFLASRLDRMRTSRAQTGCLEYTFSAAPPASPGAAVVPNSASIVVYDVTGERPLGW